MSKKKFTVLSIFIEAIGLYFSNFGKFVKYMTFPVLGQIFGLALVLVLTCFYSKEMPILIEKFESLNNFSTILVLLILITLPGLAIFTKAFWEYLVAYGAINSMLENLIKSKKVYDFEAHTELIKRRTILFIGLWFLFGIFSLVSIIPFFWVICAVLAVFFVLIFQVFTFEPDLSPIACAKRSFQLVKGNFVSTFILISLIGILTYIIIPKLAILFCDYTHLTQGFTSLIIPIVNQLPIKDLNSFLSNLYLPQLNSETIATFTVGVFISQIFIQYTLPMRSILWGLWYKKLNGGKLFSVKEEKPKKRSKKPSEKLMEASNKKYSSKKLDRNILRRAMEKDDEA